MRRFTLEFFVERARKIHGSRFNYSKFEYKNAKHKSIIICDIHGEFLQCADKHLHGRACNKCNLDFGRKKDHKTVFKSRLSELTERGCIEWLGHHNQAGYGIIVIDYKPHVAHRYAWELENGKIPHDKLIMHKCDNPTCVNLDHLQLGTSRDNARDMMKKDRGALAKLKVKDVLVIRNLLQEGVKTSIIAKKYNVDWETIQNIKKKSKWNFI